MNWAALKQRLFPEKPKMAPPLPKCVIERFEQQHGVELPADFKQYLTMVSQTVRVSTYPCLVDLEDIVGTCTIPLDDAFVSQDDTADDITHGTITIGDGGCHFFNVIVVKGNHVGSVWSVSSDSMCKTHDSFEDYVDSNGVW